MEVPVSVILWILGGLIGALVGALIALWNSMRRDIDGLGQEVKLLRTARHEHSNLLHGMQGRVERVEADIKELKQKG